MVAVVSGNSLGLSLSSMATLGQQGVVGQAVQGRSGEQVYVNVASGNLILQDRDDVLVATGIDAVALRTYNSQGTLTDDNSDNWGNGVYAPQLKVLGGINTAGSSLLRIEMDGAQSTYTYNGSTQTYTSTDGAGAYDSIAYDNRTGQFVWTDGDTQVRETYMAGGKGRLLTRADADGNSWQFIYQGNTGVLREARSASEVLKYDYTGTRLDRVTVSTIDGADVNRTSYGYDGAGRMTSVTTDLARGDNSVADGRSYITTYTYDGISKRIASVTQTDGTRLDFTYVQFGTQFRVATVTDALGQRTGYDYDLPNRRTSVTDAMGRVARYEYDAAGQLAALSEPAVGGVLQTTRFDYNQRGDVEKVTDGEGRAIDMEYDLRGNQTLQRDAQGNALRRTYNVANQLVTEDVFTVPDTDGAGPLQPAAPLVTRYVYESATSTHPRFVISPEGRVTEHRYNGALRTSTIQYNGGLFNSSGLQADEAPTFAGMLVWLVTSNPASATRVDMAYDFRGELQTQTAWTRLDALGRGVADGTQAVTRFIHNQAGELISMVDANGGATSLTYDGLGRLLSSSNALGQQTLTAYDDAGNRTSVAQANGLTTTSVFDRAGRLVSVSQNGGAAALGTSRFAYDAAGRLLMREDATGVRQWSVYDESGRKVADVDGDGSLTKYVYDRSDRLVESIAYATAVNLALLVDAQGQPRAIDLATVRPVASAADRRSWRIYDAAGRLARTIGADGAVVDTEYDGASRIVRVQAYATRIATGGLAAQLTLVGTTPATDAAADRISRNFYDGDGLLRGSVDAAGFVTELRYDNQGRLVQRLRFATPSNAALRATGTLDQIRPAAQASDQVTTLLLDAQGRVIAEVDAESYLTEYRYDRNGNRTHTIRYASKVSGPVTPGSAVATLRPAAAGEDRSTVWTYDALNRVSAETDPQGTVTTNTYDVAGNLVQSVRAAGTAESRSLLARFDLLGRTVAELSAEGAQRIALGDDVTATWAAYSSGHTYDAAGRRTSTTDANGLRTLFFYDADSRLTFTVNAAGEVSENRYDALGQLTSTVQYGSRVATIGWAGGLDSSTLRAALATSTQNSVVSYSYAAAGSLARRTDPVGHTVDLISNAFGEETSRSQSISSSAVLLTVTARDRRGLQTQVVADSGGINALTTSEYDAFGRLVRSTDAIGNERRRSYDRLGRTVTTTDATGATRGTAYDAFDRVLLQTDALGYSTRYVHDRNARSVAITSPEGVTVRTVYNRLGQTQTVTDGRGNTTSYSYDRDGRLKTSTDAGGGVVAHAYDRGGRLTQTIDAQGHAVLFDYDAANRQLTRTVDPAGLNHVTRMTYDARGRQVSVEDASGRMTRFGYDAKGQLTEQVVDPAGLNLTTTYSYDGLGSTLTVTDPSLRVTRYGYDRMGRRTSETVDPTGLALTRSYSYDKLGNLTAATDGNGNVTRYVNDGEGRVLFTVDPTGAVAEKTYDAEGQLVVSAVYRQLVNPTALSAQSSPAQVRALLGADAVPESRTNSVFDADRRLTATVNALGEVTRFSYDAAGNVVERISYANRIAGWTPGTAPQPAANPVQDQRVRTVYDTLNRAIYSVNGAGGLVAQSYDRNGNVLQRIAYPVAVDPATPATATALAAAAAAVANPARDALSLNIYDNADRLIWNVDGVGAVKQYSYDAAGRVLKRSEYATAIGAGAAPATVVPGAADRITCYAYDGAGRERFSVDALGTVSEQAYDASGNVVRQTQHSIRVAPPGAGPAYSMGQLLGLGQNAADRTQRMAYDGANRVVIRIVATGAATEMAYDGASNVVSVTQYAALLNADRLADGVSVAAMRSRIAANPSQDRTQHRFYDAANRQTYNVDALGFVKQSEYDALGRVKRTVAFDRALAAGQPPQQVPAGSRDQIDTFVYDAVGRLASSTDALGQQESYGYDGVGNRVRFTNKNGATWTYTHDAAGRLREELSPQVSTTVMVVVRYAQGIERLQESVTPDAGIVTRLAYDALGNLTARTEAAGRPGEERTTRYGYDAVGRQVRTTFPRVGVYTEGSAAAPARTETAQDLFTETTYDALGNAIASRDVASNYSYKAYDQLGAVLWEVDSLGYVTGYGRTSFGDVDRLSRYGAQTSLAAGKPASLTAAQIAAAVGAAGVDHSADRTLTSTYDAAGRAVVVTGSEVSAFDSSAPAGNLQYFNEGKTTRNTYNAFGDLTRVERLKNENTNSWLADHRYFDLRGQQVAAVDAAGFLSTQAFDAAGNVVMRTEFARAVPGWNPAAPTATAPGTAADSTDRTVYLDYDRLGRKISETRVGVEYAQVAATMSTRGDLTTTYGYDAVGNLTSTTDAAQGTTYSYYDAMGRVRAVAEPTRAGASPGSVVTPLTEFRRDAYGNVVVMAARANDASSANAGSYTATASAQDRLTRTAFDIAGRAVLTQDANSVEHYASYDAHGHVAKQWQGVTGADGVTRNLFRAFQYDAAGHQTHVIDSAPATLFQSESGGVVIVSDAGTVDTGTVFNAFGEVTSRQLNGVEVEYARYDNAGRVWKTNNGNGVDRITLYDLQDNATSDIRSNGSVNIGMVQSGAIAAGTGGLRRTDQAFDALGHMTRQMQPERTEQQGGVVIARNYLQASVVSSADPYEVEGAYLWTGTNSIALSWGSLATLGSGDVRVDIQYAQLSPGSGTGGAGGGQDEGGAAPAPATPGVVTPSIATRSFLLTDEQRDRGGVLSWTGAPMGPTGGISQVLQVTVSKKDLRGYYQTVFSQSGTGYGANTVQLDAPADATAVAELLIRPAGSAGDSGWISRPMLNFGDALRFDVSGMAAGAYEYKVLVASPGEPARTTATGTLSLTAAPLSAIAVPLSFGRPGVAAGVLTWQTPGANVGQVLRLRPTGGAWTGVPVGSVGGGLDGANLGALAAGIYEYELLWTQPGNAQPYAHATGHVTVTAAVQRPPVPARNLPEIRGVHVDTVVTGGQVIGQDENGPIYLRDAQGNIVGASTTYQMAWVAPAGSFTQLQYRPYGSSGGWSAAGSITSIPIESEYGGGMAQSVRVDTLPSGDYEYWLTFSIAGGTPTAQALGRLTIQPSAGGHFETRLVQVEVQVPVNPPPASNFIIGYAGGTAVYGPPVVVGTDPAGQPIMGEHYSRPIIAQDETGYTYGPIVAVPYTVNETRTETIEVDVRVQVGEDPAYRYDTVPVYETRTGTRDVQTQVLVRRDPVMVTDEAGNQYQATDEAGNLLFVDIYETRTAQESYTYQEQVGTETVAVLTGYTPRYETHRETQTVTTTVPVTVYPPDPSNFLIGGTLGTPIYGPPVVVGQGESGPLYGTGYGEVNGQVVAIPYTQTQVQTVSQQVWVGGAMPAPTLVDQTPVYVPAYRPPVVPATYIAANDAQPGTYSTSGGQALESSQGIGMNGETRVLRPEVIQTTDRWGNVTSATDVRYAGWVTSYRYDANNQMVEQVQPNGAGQNGLTVTRILHDRMGNQSGVVDANGNVNRQVYDAAGNLAQEIHADGGVINHNYNAFSERTETHDARGHITRFSYDLLGQQISVTRLGAGQTAFAVYASGFGSGYDYGSAEKLGVRLERVGAIVETSQYDAAGRKVSQTNGDGEVTQYGYDLRGNIVSLTRAGRLQETSAYDTQGRKVAEVDALGAIATWRYDFFGQVQEHTSLGGVHVNYSYDNARQLVRQTSGIGQVMTWSYDGAGQVIRVTDRQPGGSAYGIKVSTYGYDLAGRRILEDTTQDGLTYQDNRIAYDALGRMRWVGDGHAYVEMNYDAVGNRTRIFSHVANPGATHDDTRYFRYDAMNRQTVVDAYDAAGNDLRQRGHVLTYDLNGNRASDTFVATRIVPETQPRIAGYDESSGAIVYGATSTTYRNAGLGLVTERYGYDGMSRLKSVERDGIQTDLRMYDAAGRLLFTGPKSDLPLSYFNLANGEGSGEQPLPGTGTETRINAYDSQGRLLHMRALSNGGSGGQKVDKYEVDYRAAGSYDAAGNLKHYVMTDKSGAVTTYDNTLVKYEGYKESVVAGTSNRLQPGSTMSSYDANGFLTRVDDMTKDANDRRFVNDSLGQVLAVNQGGNVLRQLIVNGEVLARHGVGPDDLRPKTDDGEPNLVDTADFLFGYRPISPEYPTAAPGSYTVKSGDTLRSIAQTAYGDSRLWYQVAEANGLTGDADLRVGHTLTLGNIVAGSGNAAGTFQPYDPGKVVGDTSPNLPAPNPKKVSWFKKLIVVIVMMVVAYFTAGAALGAFGTAIGTTATGATIYSAGSLVVAGAIGGAAGSVASQVVGMAIGAQDTFSWKSVGLSAVAGGVTMGLGGYEGVGGVDFPAGAVGNRIAQAAVGNAISQGIGVATGLQDKFDWRGVAASAVGAAVGDEVGPAFGRAFGNLGGRIATGLTAGIAAAVAHGGKVSVQQVAVDAFGNALGQSIAQANWGGDSSTVRTTRAPLLANNGYGEPTSDQPAVYGASIIGSGPDTRREFSEVELDALSNGLQRAGAPGAKRTTLDDFGNPIDQIGGSTSLPIALRNGDPNNIIDAKRPGLYSMENDGRGEWVATRKVDAVTTDKAAINGMLNTPGYAAWLMGKHMDQEFPGTSKFTLFYNPTEGALADGWESLRDKLGLTTEISKQFAGVLSQVQASGQKVDWVAHSQGGIIFSESVRSSGADLSNNSVAFHAGGNNELVTNSIMKDSNIRVIGYRDNPFDPVPNIAGLNTLNPVRILGSVFSLPAVIWGGPESSPHTMPYVEQPKK